jgi:ElaB/YqjD/DUF883 family membrane-anchored ribosome-binding protein
MVDNYADKASSELKSLVSDAQDLFKAATTASSDKAAALRSEGMRLLDNALTGARDMQDSAVKTGREVASTADDYVHENPWKTIAISAGVALVIGALLTPMITKR